MKTLQGIVVQITNDEEYQKVKLILNTYAKEISNHFPFPKKHSKLATSYIFMNTSRCLGYISRYNPAFKRYTEISAKEIIENY